jgi:hypothetical protein
MRILCTLLVLSLVTCSTPVFAQDSDPFPLPHPSTGEPGEWTPAWLVREHVKIERDLQTCTEARDKEHEAAEKKERELQHRKAALEDQKKATEASEARNVALQQQLEAEREERGTFRAWTWVGIGGTVTAIVLFAIRESL